MKVILIRDAKNLGRVDDIVNVAEGYARNYLFPRNIAIPATKENLAQVEKRRKIEEAKGEKNLEEAKELAAKIEDVELTIEGKTGTGTKLYGSITPADIAEALEKKKGVKIDKRKIELDDPIKSLGVFEVPIRLHRDVTANIKVEVVGEQQQE